MQCLVNAKLVFLNWYIQGKKRDDFAKPTMSLQELLKQLPKLTEILKVSGKQSLQMVSCVAAQAGPAAVVCSVPPLQAASSRPSWLPAAGLARRDTYPVASWQLHLALQTTSNSSSG